MQNKNGSVVEIYTDGACSGNPGPGGWGAYLIYQNNTKEISGYSLETTNNKMELTGAIEGLKQLTRSCKIKLYTDSKYVQQGITSWIHNWQKNSWKTASGGKVKNVELWQMLWQEIQKHDVEFVWVKGHDTNEGNIKADTLAVGGRDKAIKKKALTQ